MRVASAPAPCTTVRAIATDREPLADQRWPDVDRDRLLVVPLGSTEQHGPHLPLSTDTRIAVALAQRFAARRLAARLPVTVAPALPYGASGEHAGFAGTLSIGTPALQLLLIELVRSATLTWPRVLLVSGHGGNADAVNAAVRQLRAESRDVRAWAPGWKGDAHAGHTETAVLLALDPAAVRPDLAEAGELRDVRELLGALRAGGVAAVSPNGVLGDPRGATAEHGRALLAEAGDALEAFVAGWPG